MLCPSEFIREPAAELLGTMLLTLIGNAGNCQVVLSANTGVASSPKGDYLSLAFGWACSSLTFMFCCTVHLIKDIGTGVSLGAWVAGGVTGGHVNPVVCSFPRLSPSSS
jgi:aquaglyceroporin related protein